jgi:4-hydroxybenzoate polyprenyltransferase
MKGGPRVYLDLMRVSNLPTVWTNVLAALVLSRAFSPAPFLLLGVALSFFYTGGMCLNDLLDLDEDRRRRPDRPLPSGRVPLAGAWLLAGGLLGSGFCLLLPLALRPGRSAAIAAGLLLLAAIVLYDALHRRHPATILLMAACRGLVFLTVALAGAGAIPAQVALAAALQSAWVLLVAAFARREKEHDRRPPVPVPSLLAATSTLDGLLMAAWIHPAWLLAGLAGTALTLVLQKWIRGD